jgi:hypothetical protein
MPSNKNEFKYVEYKIDYPKLIGLCELFDVNVDKFNVSITDTKHITQKQINEFLNIPSNDLFKILDSKIIDTNTYDRELIKEIFKKIDFTRSEAINSATNSIDFLKLFEELTHKQVTNESKLSNQSNQTTSETTSETSEEDEDQQSTEEQPTNKPNGLKYLIRLFKNLGIISKDKRTNKINPEYQIYFIKEDNNKQNNNLNENQQTNNLNEIKIDFTYFEPKKTNGRILRPLKLLKIIKEQGRQPITKTQLINDLIQSDFIETSKQDKQIYYYIKRGASDNFHKWLINKYF